MPKKIAEMTAAGTGATIGPIQPLGVEKEKVEEMLRRNPDLKEKHVAAFAVHADYFMLSDLRYGARVNNPFYMGDVIREGLARIVIRNQLQEVVRKKGDKYILFAPNSGKKHDPKPVATFSTKLAAKRAELAKFPPKDPKKLERLRKQIEKLLNDPLERVKEEMDDRVIKESHDRDLVERALVGHFVVKDVTERMMNERLFRQRERRDRYDAVIETISKAAMKGDENFQKVQRKYDHAAVRALADTVKKISHDLGMKLKTGSPKKHKDGKTYVEFSILADSEVPGVYAYADGEKVRTEMSSEALAALTKCSPEAADKIRSRLSMVGEGPDDKHPELVQARGEQNNYVNKITEFIDNFLAKLSPVAMSILKNLWAKKYRKLGAST